MFEITYTCRKDGYFYKRRCAKALGELLRNYNHIELKIKGCHWNCHEEMIKEKGKWFSARDFVKLDILEKEKILITVTGNSDAEELRVADEICRTLERIK